MPSVNRKYLAFGCSAFQDVGTVAVRVGRVLQGDEARYCCASGLRSMMRIYSGNCVVRFTVRNVRVDCTRMIPGKRVNTSEWSRSKSSAPL
jgi:hypothetical protein